MLKLHPAIPRLATPTQTVFGVGSSAALRSVHASRVAIVTRHEHLFRVLSKQLVAPSVEWVRPSWTGEPTIDALAGALRQVEDVGPDWFVAAGGGSVIDGAKLLWARYEHPSTSFEVRAGTASVGRLRSKARFAALPTTAGSGSEMSSAAIFIDSESGRKIPCVSPEFMPDLAILDARLMGDVPLAAVGPSALDAFAHAVEGYVSRFANDFADAYAVSAARTILDVLDTAIDGPTVEASRSKLLIAAAQAGVVQNHRVPGVGHAIAHQLAAIGISHGMATGVLLPYVIRNNAKDPETAAAYGRLAQFIGVGSSAEGLASTAETLLDTARMPRSFAACGGPPDGPTEANIIAGAMLDVCMRVNPTPVSEDDVRRILRAAWQ